MDSKPPVVLIVDDDAFVRAVIADALKDEGYTLLEARDGDEALNRLTQDKPAVVLLDLFMPKKSGLEALSEMRRRAPGCAVLVISSMDSDALVAQALRQGAAGFISKPFHPLEISKAVRGLLGL